MVADTYHHALHWRIARIICSFSEPKPTPLAHAEQMTFFTQLGIDALAGGITRAKQRDGCYSQGNPKHCFHAHL